MSLTVYDASLPGSNSHKSDLQVEAGALRHGGESTNGGHGGEGTHQHKDAPAVELIG